MTNGYLLFHSCLLLEVLNKQLRITDYCGPLFGLYRCGKKLSFGDLLLFYIFKLQMLNATHGVLGFWGFGV